MIMTPPPNESNNAPVEVSSLADFIKWVGDKRGGRNMLFRGLANAKWSVESSLYRRLKYNKVKDRYIDHSVFVEMVRMLISRSRRNGHDVKHGRELEDLALLANLQHNGAATCMIDFTKNSLVALYFACATINSEDDNNANGKVFAFNSSNANLYDEISIKGFGEKIEYWFKEYEQNKKLWILSPKRLSNRISAQQSVFVFGSPTIPTKNFDTCEIKNKKAIMEELKTYGISEETLFDDFGGFSIQNSANKEYESWDTDSYFMSGILYAISGNYKSAIECYDNDIISNPGISATYYNRGSVKIELGEFQDAISDIDEAIRLNPKSAEAYHNRGHAKNKLGEFQDAISDIDEAIRLNPKSAEAYNNRGNVKSNLGEFQDAISDFDMAIKLNPNDDEIYYNRGIAKIELGEFQDAISDFDEAIRLNPRYSFAYNNRGSVKSELGEFQDAISDIDEAIRLNPKNAEAYHNRGVAKIKLGEFQDAISDIDEAIRLNSKNAEAYHNRGHAKGNLGEFQDSISDFDEAIRLDPQYALAYYSLGVANMGLNNIEVARVNFAKAKELGSKINIPDLPPSTPTNNY